MSPLIVCIAVFIGVTALVVGLSYVMRGDKEAEVEDRLSVLTGGKKSGKAGISLKRICSRQCAKTAPAPPNASFRATSIFACCSSKPMSNSRCQTSC